MTDVAESVIRMSNGDVMGVFQDAFPHININYGLVSGSLQLTAYLTVTHQSNPNPVD